MIPYDELVAALTNWRARQGLPVQGGAPPISAVPPPIQQATPASGAISMPTSAPMSQHTRQGPPAPPRTPAAPAKPYDPYGGDSAVEVDDALLEEAHYDNEGNDFAMQFGQIVQEGESTAIGSPPSRDTMPETDPDDIPPPPPPSRKKRR